METIMGKNVKPGDALGVGSAVFVFKKHGTAETRFRGYCRNSVSKVTVVVNRTTQDGSVVELDSDWLREILSATKRRVTHQLTPAGEGTWIVRTLRRGTVLIPPRTLRSHSDAVRYSREVRARVSNRFDTQSFHTEPRVEMLVQKYSK